MPLLTRVCTLSAHVGQEPELSPGPHASLVAQEPAHAYDFMPPTHTSPPQHCVPELPQKSFMHRQLSYEQATLSMASDARNRLSVSVLTLSAHVGQEPTESPGPHASPVAQDPAQAYECMLPTHVSEAEHCVPVLPQ